MRSKACFSSKPDKEFDYFLLPDGKADVFIYDLSSIEEVRREGLEEDYVEYQCDMNEFRVDANEVTQDMVMASPIKYLDYEVEPQKTNEEKIKDLQEQNDMLTQCVLEMSELVYQ